MFLLVAKKSIKNWPLRLNKNRKCINFGKVNFASCNYASIYLKLSLFEAFGMNENVHISINTRELAASGWIGSRIIFPIPSPYYTSLSLW